MPKYVYHCSTCQKEFEAEQRITEDPLKDCPCGATSGVKRLIQPTAILFKGSGFHINDYQASSVAKDASTTTPQSSSPGPTEPCKVENSTCPCTADSSA